DVSVVRRDDELLIRVDDEGPGIPRDKLEEVLKPFSRLDEARQRNTRGLGLGLAIVAKAVEREGGLLTLANRPGGGLRAEICLPLPAVPTRR
ncbi:MAG TPA: ATP-binding protein, partial [Sphingobium sp.]|nr:ATP-binding protein [Sphingobium sp.]